MKYMGFQIVFNILKAQWQKWDICQGVSSLGVKFTRKILAWYDKLFSS